MPAEWRFVVPRNQTATFSFISDGGSRRGNFLEIWIGTTKDGAFNIVNSYPCIKMIQKKNVSVEYTLKAFNHEIGSGADIRPSEIRDVPVTPGKEWILTLLESQGKQVQVGLLISG